jgi:predicted NodU family carbamoyl transferase
MAKILSISAIAHDCGVALIEDGIVKYAFDEERFRRVKGIFIQFLFPDLSLQALEKETGITPFDDDVIVVMSKSVLCGLDYIEKILDVKDIYLFDHHYAHACTAYYLSGFSEETLVLTYDAGDSNGIHESVLTKEVLQKIYEQKLPFRKTEIPEEDFIKLARGEVDRETKFFPYQVMMYPDSWWKSEDHIKNRNNCSVYIGNGSKLTNELEYRNFDSIASLWDAFCLLNNMFGGKDEGKIVGMASQGSFNTEINEAIGHFFDFNEGFFWEHYWDVRDYFESLDLKNRKIQMDASFMLQYLTEKYFLEAIGYLKQKFPSCKKLALAGGLFSNVKLNQKINELSEFDEIFIAPGMGDGGLAIGAAIAKANELGEFDVQTIDNVFWGNKTDTNFIHPGVEETELNYSQIASELSEGKVVGIFSNRREWGPRALGGTSIMFDPRREDAQEYVNRRLNRNEVMPFAPVVMDGFESVPFYCYKSKYASQFMTICYPVKEEWVNKIPGVINRFDNTSRIQIAKKDNKPFFPILEAFKEITGVPVLMNTSFNVHGEPIINETEQAMKHLVNGVVDILVVDDKVYRKKTSVFDI